MAARNEQQQIVINATYELFVLGVVLLSMGNNVALFFRIGRQPRDLIGIVEFCITGFLLCDFLYRMFRARRRKRDYLITYYGWLDFVGSLPFTGARLARLIRLVILGRKLRRSDLLAMGEVVITHQAESALLGVVLLVIIVLELGGLSMLKVEAGAPNANITTASDALWWGTVTVATVGYGDRYPVTDLGRIVGVLVMTVGLGLFSVLISFLADWFRRPRRVRRAAAPPADPRAQLREATRLLEAQAAAHEHSLRVLADLRAQLADIEQALAERERGDPVDVELSESLSEERHTTDNRNIHAVIAIFAGKAAAEQAIDALKRWDGANADIKLGAIGTITKEGDKVRTHVGRMTGKGTTVGAIIGVIAVVLSSGLTIVGGAVGGAALGGVVGTFMKQSLNLTEQEIQAIGAELDAGKVAVLVACDAYEIEGATAQLSSAGGAIRVYTISQDALAEVGQAVAVADWPPAPPSVTPGTAGVPADGQM
jgi:voltage-gated potassium channel Kch